MTYYIHHLPGRIRIETPFIHGNPSHAQQFEAELKAIGGILSVQTDPVTGSAIIHYDEGKIRYEQVISFLEQRGYFKLSEAQTNDQYIEKAAEKVLGVAEKIAEGALGVEPPGE